MVFRVQHHEPPTVQVAANLFQKLCYENKDNLMAGIIVGGYDKLKGGSVYSIPLGGSLHQQPFAIGGTAYQRDA
jgi:20S proteasome subunit beta 1